VTQSLRLRAAAPHARSWQSSWSRSPRRRRFPDGFWNGAAHFAQVQSLADGTCVIDKHLNQGGDIS
jgi:hypothetical protein